MNKLSEKDEIILKAISAVTENISSDVRMQKELVEMQRKAEKRLKRMKTWFWVIVGAIVVLATLFFSV